MYYKGKFYRFSFFVSANEASWALALDRKNLVKKQKATHTCRFKCFHNGIILIVTYFQNVYAYVYAGANDRLIEKNHPSCAIIREKGQYHLQLHRR